MSFISFNTKTKIWSTFSLSILSCAVLMALSACMPDQATRRFSTTQSSTSSSDTTTDQSLDDTTDYYWYTNKNIGYSVVLPSKTTTVGNLRGAYVHQFLGNSNNINQKYCLVMDFSLGSNSSIKQLRVSLQPSTLTNTLEQKTEKYLRVDFGETSSNQAFCSGTLLHSSGNSINSSVAGSVAFTPANICPSCISTFNSSKIRIYKANTSGSSGATISDIDEIDSSQLAFPALLISFDPNLNPGSGETSTCDGKNCTEKGYDCCLQGQCVFNGNEKPNASLNPNYAQAIKDKSSNINKIIDYPDIFYICQGIPLPSTPNATDDTVTLDSRRLQYLKELYFCLYYKTLDDTDESFCKPDYTKVKNAIWSLCSCTTVGGTAPEDPASTCPTYGLNAYDNLQKILKTPGPGFIFTESLNYNFNNKKEVYIRGLNIHNYLASSTNASKKYCMVATYNSVGAAKQLRLIATPTQFITAINTTVWGLKLAMHNESSNEVVCQGTIGAYTASSAAANPGNVVFTEEKTCPSSTCNSLTLKLYYSATGNGISDTSYIGDVDMTPLALNLKVSNVLSPISSSSNIFLMTKVSDPIQSISCKINSEPAVATEVFVSGRTVPHRFFMKNGGTEVTDIATLSITTEPTISSVAEGDALYYIDNNNKRAPVMQDYSMTAVLGQFRVDLSAAKPAAILTVEPDQLYLIAPDIAGDYSPCPTCVRDSWLQTLTAFPPSRYGAGNQAYIYTASRDEWKNNISIGNYEDTHFGRACYVPPTMIPFSHNKANSLQEQRLNRLSTQAALFINGHQRDWYGFNQGALIGSFNGVNWFAIGKQRSVLSTSNKLFLAINSPFGDLAGTNGYKVRITPDSGEVKYPALDFDPNITNLSSSLQNEAGTCQRFHYCKVDAECISRLGFEYMCANVSSYRTLWPVFDINGNEKAGQSKIVGFGSLITGGLPNPSQKRCVYRGAGAPCVQNFTDISNHELRKMFTCAPNFYCALVGTNSFNSKIKREPNNLGSILYGYEANILGRSEKFMKANNLLKEEIKKNLEANSVNTVQEESLSSSLGLCMPGPSLNYDLNTGPNPALSHANIDTQSRTDFISKIGGCNADAKTVSSGSAGPTILALQRLHLCPLLDDNGNYVYTEDLSNDTYTVPQKEYLIAQNSCGSESLTVEDDSSVFKNIEANPITSTLYNLLTKKVAKNACLRRAGSVCHSDYDCSPNKMHAVEANHYPLSDDFGGTEAEHNYWKEYLVCGPTANTYNTLDTSFPIGRCCRPTGELFTMYTQGDPNTSEENALLKTNVNSQSPRNPGLIGRYSRYAVVPGLSSTEVIPASTDDTIVPTIPYVSGYTNPVRPNKYQWKTFHDTGAKSCCGGWIRLFNDKTHNWPTGSRLTFDITEFKCLNFRTPLAVGDTAPSFSNLANFEIEKGILCQDPGKGGCAHYMGESLQGFDQSRTVIKPPSEMTDDTAIVYAHSAARAGFYHDFAPYQIQAATEVYYLFHTSSPNASCGVDPSPDSRCIFSSNTGSERQYMRGTDSQIILHLPSYIKFSQITGVYLSRRYQTPPTGALDIQYQNIYNTPVNIAPGGASSIPNCVLPVPGAGFYDVSNTTNYICYNPTTGLLYIRRSSCHRDPTQAGCTNDAGQTWSTQNTGIMIGFRPISTHPINNNPYSVNWSGGINPGNDLYYLEKLARFELLGIPQIYYEPLYCNSDRNTLVGGLFNLDSNTRTSFISASFQLGSEQTSDNGTARKDDASIYNTRTSSGSYNVNNIRAVFDNKVSKDKVFSSYEFACCVRLGQKTDKKENCCSGFADSNLLCKLPVGTDLNVYFNRFISGEGSYADLSSDVRLLDKDFDPQTGYPKLDGTNIIQKLISLGTIFCSTGRVFTGGAFGQYGPRPRTEPYWGTATPVPYGILYQTSDGQLSTGTAGSVEGSRGFVRFSDGRRWNHHLYCGSTP